VRSVVCCAPHRAPYLSDSLEDWLSEALEGYGEDDCVIFDCPGQIELYSHHSAFRTFVDQMHAWGWRMVGRCRLTLPHLALTPD